MDDTIKAPAGSGYVYELEGPHSWKRASSEEWPIEVYGWKGDESCVGQRTIDGARCVVFVCRDGKYRAVTLVSVGG